MRPLFLSCGLLFFLICGSVASSPSLKPVEPATSSQHESKAGRQGTEKLPLFVNENTLPPLAQENKTVTISESKEKWEPDWWLVLLTAALVIATLLLWHATKSLVKGAEDTAERQLRAYLDVFHCSMRGIGTGNIFFDFSLKNYGQTPAHKMAWSRCCEIISVAEARALVEEIPRDLTRNIKPAGPVAPGVVIQSRIAYNISAEDTAALRNETKAVFLWLGIDYIDSFDRPQRTDCCYFLGGGQAPLRDGEMSRFADGKNQST